MERKEKEKKQNPDPMQEPGEMCSELSLEESFDRLEGLLGRLEDRELPLEEAFALYQQGVELLRQCSAKIDTVEKKILMMNGDGGFDEF